MSTASTNITIRMDADIKARAENMFEEFGMNMSTAFNIFIRQALREGRIPFDISLNQPNRETLAALLEGERLARDPSAKRYSDVDEALRALKE